LSILDDIPNITVKANENLKWFVNNHDMLIAQYLNRYIAINDGKVIGVDYDIHELLNKIKDNEGYSKSTLIEFITAQRNVKLII